MQQCSCINTYRYPNGPDGTPICVICGADWPEDVDGDEVVSPEVERRAKELYHDHMKDKVCLWDKCSDEYQKAWILIAEKDLE